MRYTDGLKTLANFLNHGSVDGRLKGGQEVERLREELKQDIRRVLSTKVPLYRLGVIHQKSVTIRPIDVTANGEHVGSLLLLEGRIKPGLTTLEFVDENGQLLGPLTIDYKLTPLDEYRAALYKVVWQAIFDRRIGKLRQCPRCERFFLSKFSREAYCRRRCKTEAKHEQVKRRVQKWRKKQKQAEER